jgi:hypothetical protein
MYHHKDLYKNLLFLELQLEIIIGTILNKSISNQ